MPKDALTLQARHHLIQADQAHLVGIADQRSGPRSGLHSAADGAVQEGRRDEEKKVPESGRGGRPRCFKVWIDSRPMMENRAQLRSPRKGK